MHICYVIHSIHSAKINGDMVGHTGIYEAIEKPVKTIDICCHDVCEAAKEADYEVIIIADHGNCDFAVNADGTPNTAHSLNPVPCVYISKNEGAKVADGKLCDVAPTILGIMGIAQPAELIPHYAVCGCKDRKDFLNLPIFS